MQKKESLRNWKHSNISPLWGATITSNNKEVTNISFSKSDFSLADMETNTTTYTKTQEISSIKLIKCINNYYKFKKDTFKKYSKNIQNCTVENINNILKELYKRFIIPFYIPILTLIPFLLIIISKENSKYHKLRLITFLIGLTVIIFSETTIRLVSNSVKQNISLIIIPLIIFLTLYLYLFNKFKIKERV